MKNDQLLLSGEVCKLLNIPRYKLTYLFENHRIPETSRIGGKRVFSPEDVLNVKKALSKIEERRSEIARKQKNINL